MTADLSALIARLEAAEVGSRELDMAVHKAATGENMGFATPDASRSLDAALALAERVLPGYAMNVCLDKDRDGTLLKWSSQVARHGLSGPVGRGGWWFGIAPTPALALCIAILRAKQGEG